MYRIVARHPLEAPAQWIMPGKWTLTISSVLFFGCDAVCFILFLKKKIVFQLLKLSVRRITFRYLLITHSHVARALSHTLSFLPTIIDLVFPIDKLGVLFFFLSLSPLNFLIKPKNNQWLICWNFRFFSVFFPWFEIWLKHFFFNFFMSFFLFY